MSHEISTSLECEFCMVALEKRLERGMPEIFNTDNGSRFTTIGFARILEANCVRTSMDGKGRGGGNIFTE